MAEQRMLEDDNDRLVLCTILALGEWFIIYRDYGLQNGLTERWHEAGRHVRSSAKTKKRGPDPKNAAMGEAQKLAQTHRCRTRVDQVTWVIARGPDNTGPRTGPFRRVQDVTVLANYDGRAEKS